MATALHNLSDYNPAAIPSAEGMRFGIVVSEWNHNITGTLLQGAHDTLVKQGVAEEHILTMTVPGSFELVFGAAQMAKSGKVEFEGKDITRMPGHKIVSLGMAHVPEGRRVFSDLTVLENLKMGAYTQKDKGVINETLKMIYKRFPRLEERKNQQAGTLSGGEQQMLAMGRALMSQPKIILMDEPSMGLSPIFVNEIFDIIQEVSAAGTTVLLVEQNAKKALGIADRAYVLETGKIALEGAAKDLLNNDSVKKAYLGE